MQHIYNYLGEQLQDDPSGEAAAQLRASAASDLPLVWLPTKQAAGQAVAASRTAALMGAARDDAGWSWTAVPLPGRFHPVSELRYYDRTEVFENLPGFKLRSLARWVRLPL